MGVKARARRPASIERPSILTDRILIVWLLIALAMVIERLYRLRYGTVETTTFAPPRIY